VVCQDYSSATGSAQVGGVFECTVARHLASFMAHWAPNDRVERRARRAAHGITRQASGRSPLQRQVRRRFDSEPEVPGSSADR